MADIEVIVLSTNVEVVGAAPQSPIEITHEQVVAEVDTVGVQGVQGIVGPVGIITVQHGTNPAVARPEAGIVHWVGTATPTNAIPSDFLTRIDL